MLTCLITCTKEAEKIQDNFVWKQLLKIVINLILF